MVSGRNGEKADEGAYRRWRLRWMAAAAYLFERRAVWQDITIYEAGERLGGLVAGSAATGYILPTGSVFDAKFRCTFDLLATIPSAGDPAISVKDDFFAFNERYPFRDRVHIIDRDGRVVHTPHFGLSVRDRLDLVRLALTPEAMLDRRRIDEFFRPEFFTTEFWLLWTTIMGPLPQSSAMEMRRYMNRFLPLLPDLSTMSHVLRTRLDQYEALIVPLVAWLRPRGVTFLTGAFVRDIGFTAITRPYHGRSARLRTPWRDNLPHRCARGHRAGDPRFAGRRSFGGIDDRGASAAAGRAGLDAVAAPCAGTLGFRQSRRVLRRRPSAQHAMGNLHCHHDRV